MRIANVIGILTGFVFAATAVQAAMLVEQVRTTMTNENGGFVGVIALRQTPNGTLLHAWLQDLPEGAHAFHIHAVGECASRLLNPRAVIITRMTACTAS